MNNLVICPKKYTLQCFLLEATIKKCFHSSPHKQDVTCKFTVCCYIGKTGLGGCICKPVEEKDV